MNSPATNHTTSTDLTWHGHMGTDLAATSGTTPRAQLTANSEVLKLQGTLGSFNIPRSSIARIQRASLYPWLFSGIRIRHSLPQISKKVLFCPAEIKTRTLLNALKALGYPVN